jgi:ketosteroid isomerase-like protein
MPSKPQGFRSRPRDFLGTVPGSQCHWPAKNAVLPQRDTAWAMSEENVELVRRAADAFSRRDLDRFLALMAEDVGANPQLAGIEGGYHGHDGIRRWWNTLFDLIPDFTSEVVEVRDYGDDLVIAAMVRSPPRPLSRRPGCPHASGRERASGGATS